MLDADGDDDPAGYELLAVGEHEFEAVSSPDHAGDENLFDLQVEFGLEPLTVADERFQRYRVSVALIWPTRGPAEGL